MRNKVIENMVCQQFGWDFRDVEVEFLSACNGRYEFKVTHWAGEKTEHKVVEISVRDYKEENK